MNELITKRDGQQVPFDVAKIIRAIERAGKETGEYGKHEAVRLADEVVRTLGENLTVRTYKTLSKTYCSDRTISRQLRRISYIASSVRKHASLTYSNVD